MESHKHYQNLPQIYHDLDYSDHIGHIFSNLAVGLEVWSGPHPMQWLGATRSTALPNVDGNCLKEEKISASV